MIESRIMRLKSVSTLQTHEIINHKLQKTKLFRLYYKSYFPTKKRKNLLHKHSQNKHLSIYAFYFFRFIYTQFTDFKNTNADNIS